MFSTSDRLRRSLPALSLSMALLAGCVGPLAPKRGTEGNVSAERGGKVKVAVGGRVLTLSTLDGRDLVGLSVLVGGKTYVMKDGKLSLPAGALEDAKRLGGLVLIAPGYVPRRIGLDDTAGVLIPTIALASVALGPQGGTLRAAP